MSSYPSSEHSRRARCGSDRPPVGISAPVVRRATRSRAMVVLPCPGLPSISTSFPAGNHPGHNHTTGTGVTSAAEISSGSPGLSRAVTAGTWSRAPGRACWRLCTRQGPAGGTGVSLRSSRSGSDTRTADAERGVSWCSGTQLPLRNRTGRHRPDLPSLSPLTSRSSLACHLLCCLSYMGAWGTGLYWGIARFETEATTCHLRVTRGKPPKYGGIPTHFRGRSGTVTATGRSRQLVAIAFTRLVRPGGPTTVSFDTARLNPT